MSRNIAVGVCALGFLLASSSSTRAAIELSYDLGGNAPGTVFGWIYLEDSLKGGVDVRIAADTAALKGGDIHQWYFNLSDKWAGLSKTDFVLSDFGGESNRSIGSFTMLGPNPPVAGGAGARFEWGVSFGNGGGPAGNGILTVATFNIDAPGGLKADDFLSAPLSSPNNTPQVLQAVHFQSTNVLGQTSLTVGGLWGKPGDDPSNDPLGNHPVPEPATLAIWACLFALGLSVVRRRKMAS